TKIRAVTAGKRYQVARRPHASSSAAATRPPWTIPGAAWLCSSKWMYASYSSIPSHSGGGRCSPVALSPHPQHAGSWCGGIGTRLIPISSSAKPATLGVRAEEVLAAGARHRCAGGDLERERRGRHALC